MAHQRGTAVAFWSAAKPTEIESFKKLNTVFSSESDLEQAVNLAITACLLHTSVPEGQSVAGADRELRGVELARRGLGTEIWPNLGMSWKVGPGDHLFRKFNPNS